MVIVAVSLPDARVLFAMAKENKAALTIVFIICWIKIRNSFTHNNVISYLVF